jgi:hypothetical protein
MQNVATIRGDVNHENKSDTPEHRPSVASPRRAATYTVEQATATASGLVAVAFAATGLSRRAAADGCGVNRNLADSWASPDHPRTMPLGRILALAMTSRRGREAAITILAGALSHVQEIAVGMVPDRDLRGLVDDLHAEVGDVAAEWRAANRDGVITAEEREVLAREVSDVERVLAGLRRELGKGEVE